MKRIRLSVRARYALATSVLALLLALAVSIAVTTVYARFVRHAIIRQQEAFVGQVAQGLSDDLTHAQNALAASARLVDDALLTSPFDAERFLEDQEPLRTIFDYSLLLLDAEGRLLAETRRRPELLGTSFSDVDYIRDTLKAKRPIISDPYISATDRFHPVVMFTMPILDESGVLRGILCGGMDLMKDNLLARPSALRIGETGYLAVYTPEGTVITHTDREAILAGFISPELNDADVTDKGTAETLDFLGVPVLLTMTRLPITGWIVAASYPQHELYAPFHKARRFTHGIMVGCIALAVLAGYAMSAWLTRPLQRLTREVDRIGRAPTGSEQHVTEEGADEIARVSGAINRMLRALEGSRQAVERLSADLIRAEERERRRIAADLHDSICQTLAVANLQLGQLGGMDVPPKAKVLADHVRTILTTSVEEMRTLLFDLSPPILYELGLPAALEWYAHRYEERFGIALTLETAIRADAIEEERAIFLYRAASEFLINAAKHAHTKTIRVRLAPPLTLLVEDDGIGLPAAQDRTTQANAESNNDAQSDKGTGCGFGLQAIRERCRLLGGSLSVTSGEQGGVRIFLSLPVNESQTDHASVD